MNETFDIIVLTISYDLGRSVKILRIKSFHGLNEEFQEITIYFSRASCNEKQKTDICAVISIAKPADVDRTKNHSKK